MTDLYINHTELHTSSAPKFVYKFDNGFIDVSPILFDDVDGDYSVTMHFALNDTNQTPTHREDDMARAVADIIRQWINEPTLIGLEVVNITDVIIRSNARDPRWYFVLVNMDANEIDPGAVTTDDMKDEQGHQY